MCCALRLKAILLNRTKFSYERYDPDPSLKLFTSDNYIFHKEKHLFFKKIALAIFCPLKVIPKEVSFQKIFRSDIYVFHKDVHTNVHNCVIFNFFCCDVIISVSYVNFILITYQFSKMSTSEINTFE